MTGALDPSRDRDPVPVLDRSRDSVDRFVDALWVEDGLAQLTLAAYRRDLILYAAWLAAESGRDIDATQESDLLGYIAARHAGTRATTANCNGSRPAN